jgi:hypothetical protein
MWTDLGSGSSSCPPHRVAPHPTGAASRRRTASRLATKVVVLAPSDTALAPVKTGNARSVLSAPESIAVTRQWAAGRELRAPRGQPHLSPYEASCEVVLLGRAGGTPPRKNVRRRKTLNFQTCSSRRL